MIKGIGIDAADPSRVADLIERFGERFTRRVFTPSERAFCDGRPRPHESYAARFAAKEAAMKALGSGWGSGVRFVEIEVRRGGRGAPELSLAGGAEKRAHELGVVGMHVSLTHERDMAVAVVVAEWGAGR